MRLGCRRAPATRGGWTYRVARGRDAIASSRTSPASGRTGPCGPRSSSTSPPGQADRARGRGRPRSLFRADCALMLHEAGASEADAQAYLERWGLMTPALAAQIIRFLG